MEMKIIFCFLCVFVLAQALEETDSKDSVVTVEEIHKDDHVQEVTTKTFHNESEGTYGHSLEVLIAKLLFHKDHKDKGNSHSHGEVPCLDFAQRLVSKIVPPFFSCSKEMHLKHKDLKTKLKSALPFNGNGSFDEGYYWKFLHEEVPKRFHKHANTIVNTCQGEVEMIDGEEPECQSYKQLLKCVVHTLMQLVSGAVKLCTDIPSDLKETAIELFESERTKELIHHYID